MNSEKPLIIRNTDIINQSKFVKKKNKENKKF